MITRALRPGSALDIVVSYPTEGGRVAGEVASDSHRVVSGAGGIIFSLKKKLNKVPAGPVCMQLRLNRRQTVPLRVPNSFTSSNEFYYAPWSERISIESRRAVMATQIGKAQRQLERAKTDERTLQRRMDDTLQGAENCEDYRPSVAKRAPSRNVLPPDQWEDETERECTHRFVAFVGSKASVANAVEVITGSVIKVHQNRTPGRRAQQLDDIVTRRLPEMTGYETRLSAINKLPVTRETMKALNSESKTALLGAYQGIVDAFDSCLKEVLPQFRSAYEAWQAERDSGYDAELAQTAVLECNLIATDLRKSSAQRQAVEEQLAALKTEVAEIAAPNGASGQDAQRVYSLLNETCPAAF